MPSIGKGHFIPRISASQAARSLSMEPELFRKLNNTKKTMNDNHLDPPDYPEPPDWYSSLEILLSEENPPETVAAAIRQAMKVWDDSRQEYDPGPELFDDLPDDFFKGPDKCPHGNKWSECDACDHASDIAYDAVRERKS